MSEPTAEQTKRLDAFLSWIRADLGRWPRTAQDWAPLKALIDEGVDVATAKGSKLNITVFHRLAKHARKDRKGVFTDKERAQAFLDLAKLTDGRALDMSFDTEWFCMSVSFSTVQCHPDFYRGLVEAGLWGREGRGHEVAQAFHRPWYLLHLMAMSLDDPGLLNRVIAAAPADLNPLHDICYGGERIFSWLVAGYERELVEGIPVKVGDHTVEGARCIPLAEEIRGHSYLGGICAAMESWLAARGVAQRLDGVLGRAGMGEQGNDAQSRRGLRM